MPYKTNYHLTTKENDHYSKQILRGKNENNQAIIYLRHRDHNNITNNTMLLLQVFKPTIFISIT